MGLNKQKGNMYGFVTHTWNAIKGKCAFDCSYCYMKRFKNQKPARLDNTEFDTDLGKGNFIFVGSSIDMFACNIPGEWIHKTLEYLHQFENDNQFLFQSKDPSLFINFCDIMPKNTTLATTIETNRNMADISKAPDPLFRANAIRELKDMGFKTMVTVEPILDFDLHDFVILLKYTKADQINIGAVTGGHNLPEPSKDKLDKLISAINPHLKSNINRLIK